MLKEEEEKRKNLEKYSPNLENKFVVIYIAVQSEAFKNIFAIKKGKCYTELIATIAFFFFEFNVWEGMPDGAEFDQSKNIGVVQANAKKYLLPLPDPKGRANH